MTTSSIPRPSPAGRRRRTLRVAGAVLTAGGLIALAACGTNSNTNAAAGASTGSSTSPTSASSATGTGSSSGQVISNAELAKLQAVVNQAEQVPQFTTTGPAFDASKIKGDKFLVMPSNTGIAYCADIASGIVSLGKKLGVSVTNIATEGTVSQWTAGALQGVTAGVQAEGLICGIPPSVVSPQMQLAKEHNIKVVFDQSYDLGAPSSYLAQEVAPSGLYQTGVPESQAARILVDKSFVDHDGKPFDTLILTSSDIFISPGILAATEDQIKTLCPSCGYTVENIPIADWATRTQSTVASALAADPKIQSIQVLFAGMTVTGGLAAAEAAHRPGLKIYEWGAGNGDMQQIPTSDGIVAGDIGCGSDWTYYNLMDQMMRVALNQPAISVTAEACKTRLFTSANYKSFLDGDGWGNSYVAGYDKEWELSS